MYSFDLYRFCNAQISINTVSFYNVYHFFYFNPMQISSYLQGLHSITVVIQYVASSHNKILNIGNLQWKKDDAVHKPTITSIPIFRL